MTPNHLSALTKPVEMPVENSRVLAKHLRTVLPPRTPQQTPNTKLQTSAAEIGHNRTTLRPAANIRHSATVNRPTRTCRAPTAAP